MALLIFLLHFGILKSRFHYFRHQNLIFHYFWIFQPLEPRIHGFYYTKILQKILENIWEHPQFFLVYMYFKKMTNLEKTGTEK